MGLYRKPCKMYFINVGICLVTIRRIHLIYEYMSYDSLLYHFIQNSCSKNVLLTSYTGWPKNNGTAYFR